MNEDFRITKYRSKIVWFMYLTCSLSIYWRNAMSARNGYQSNWINVRQMSFIQWWINYQETFEMSKWNWCQIKRMCLYFYVSSFFFSISYENHLIENEMFVCVCVFVFVFRQVSPLFRVHFKHTIQSNRLRVV